MKKALIILLAVCLALLSACGSPIQQQEGSGTNAPADSSGAKRPIAVPETYTDPSVITVDASVLARADGQTLDWDAAPADTEDTTGVTASEFDAAGWPDNEFTRGLPMPLTGKVSMAGNDEETGAFVIMFEGMPYESFLEYVELLKEAGYTQNAQTEDFAAYGMGDGIMYVAAGPNGQTIEAMCAMGTTMLSIAK